MTSIAIQAVDPPQCLSRYSYSIPSNSVALKKNDCSFANLLIDHLPLNQFDTLLELQVVINAYQERIKVLRCEGEMDGITLNTRSEEDFYLFVKSAPYTGRASLVLIDNGNLRAVWRGNDGSHCGVQFRGDQSASYVIFKCRSSRSDVSRVSGTDTLDGIKEQIHVFGLETLLNT